MRKKRIYTLALTALVFLTAQYAIAATNELDECIKTLNSISQEYPVNFKQAIIDVCNKKFTDQMAALPIESPDSEYSALEEKRKAIAAIGGNPEGKSPLSNDEKIKTYDTLISAKQGNIDAQYALSKIFRNYEPADQAALQELQWLTLSANGGYVPAQTLLGDIYRTGKNGLEKNTKIAREWYQKAASQKNGDAMYQLAYLLIAGDGGAVDTTRAITLIKEAEQFQPNSQALSLLAETYMNGSGTDKNWKEAASILKRIANLPISSSENEKIKYAAYTLGNLYEEGGYGLKKDLSEAKYWYLKTDNFNDTSIRLQFLGNPKGLALFRQDQDRKEAERQRRKEAEQQRIDDCSERFELCKGTCARPVNCGSLWGCTMVEDDMCVSTCVGFYRNCINY